MAHPALMFFALLTLVVSLTAGAREAIAPQRDMIALGNDETLEVMRFPATTDSAVARVIWLSSEHGLQADEMEVVTALSRLGRDRGVEILVPDLFSSFFLPTGKENLEKIGPRALQSLLDDSIRSPDEEDSPPILIVAADRAAAVAVKTLSTRQQEKTPSSLALILLNPDLFTGTPKPGQQPEFIPEASALNLPIYLLQAEKSPWRWSLARLESILSSAGSDVFVQTLPNVRDRFYFRPDATSTEEAEAQKLPVLLLQAMRLLAPYMIQPRTVGKSPPQINASVAEQNKEEKQAHHLSPYTGPQDKSFALPDLGGTVQTLHEWRGRVVIVNFWASWCPPCVHEIPSMVALKEQLKSAPFEIVAINLGEPREEIEAFLKKHPVNFPVLLDKDQKTARAWGVFAYPTTFLVDANGQIRYALAGGEDWSQPEIVSLIRSLLPEH